MKELNFIKFALFLVGCGSSNNNNSFIKNFSSHCFRVLIIISSVYIVHSKYELNSHFRLFFIELVDLPLILISSLVFYLRFYEIFKIVNSIAEKLDLNAKKLIGRKVKFTL